MKLFVASINFDLLRYYVLPALAFLALLLVFIYIISEKRGREE